MKRAANIFWWVVSAPWLAILGLIGLLAIASDRFVERAEIVVDWVNDQRRQR